MIDRAYRQAVADDVRPGWLIAGLAPGISRVTAVVLDENGVDIAFRPSPRATGNSQHVQAKPLDEITRVADDSLLDRIELLLVEAITAVDDAGLVQVASAAVFVVVDGITWALPLRSHGDRQAPPVDDANLTG